MTPRPTRESEHSFTPNSPELRESEVLSSALIEEAPFGVYLVDGDFKLRAINRGSRAVFAGIEPLLGRDFAEILRIVWPEPFASEAIGRFRQTLESGDPFLSPPVTESRANADVEESYDWQIHRVAMPEGGFGVVCYFYDLTVLRRSELEVRRSRERLGLAVRLSKIALGEVDYASGTFRLSKEAAALYGLGDGSTELVTTRERVHATFHPDERDELERDFARALNPAGDGLLEREHRVVHPDGSERWLSLSKQVFFDRNLEPHRPLNAILAIQDVTERRRHEANLAFLVKLQEALSRLSSPSDIAREAGDRIVQHLGLSRCVFVEIDEAARTAVVFAERGTPGAPSQRGTYALADFHTEDERRRLASGQAVAIRNVRDAPRSEAATSDFEALGIRSIGSAPYISKGRWTFALGAQHAQPHAWREDEVQLLVDLVKQVFPRLERARAEAALRHSEAFSRTVLEASPDCVKLLDPEGRLVSINGNGARMLEIEDRAAWTGSPWAELWPDEFREPIEDSLLAARRGESSRFQGFALTLKSTPRWWDVIVTPILDSHGDLTHVLAVSRDIGEAKRVEERLRQVNEAQGRFVSDASHEFRAPLTAIQGNLELLIRYPNMPQGDHDEVLRDASGEARRMGRLVSDLLTAARGETVQESFQTVRLDRLLEGAWRTARLLSERRRFDLGVLEPATIEGDQDALKQLALILLENAVKYTPDDCLVRLESKLLAGWVEFSVSDGGFGIPAEELPRIFERFYRADLARTHGDHPGGNGLGLTIAKRIAENHGGEIRVESEFGRGTTFTVRLPVVVDED